MMNDEELQTIGHLIEAVKDERNTALDIDAWDRIEGYARALIDEQRRKAAIRVAMGAMEPANGVPA